MTSIITFDTSDPVVAVRNGWLYPLSLLLKCAHTAHLIADFRAVGPLIDAAIKTRSDLEDACVIAIAGRDEADNALDPLLWQIINALLIYLKNDRDDPHFISYVGGQTPSEIVKPLLGAELVTASEWVEPLEHEDDPLLRSFAPPLAALVAIGQTAENDVKTSKKALADFQSIGEWKRVVDLVNAARGSLLGALVKFQHENPHLRLPSDWAESFFQRSVRASKFGDTVQEVEECLLRLAADTAAAQDSLAALKAKVAERQKAKEDRAQARLKLSASRKEGRERRRQEKVLEAEARKKL